MKTNVATKCVNPRIKAIFFCCLELASLLEQMLCTDIITEIIKYLMWPDVKSMRIVFRRFPHIKDTDDYIKYCIYPPRIVPCNTEHIGYLSYSVELSLEYILCTNTEHNVLIQRISRSPKHKALLYSYATHANDANNQQTLIRNRRGYGPVYTIIAGSYAGLDAHTIHKLSISDKLREMKIRDQHIRRLHKDPKLTRNYR